MNHFEIVAMNFAVPPRQQTSAELASAMGCEANWIAENVGVERRHVCDLGDDPAELAAKTARPIIERFGSPDLLIYASASIRQCIPDTSVFVSQKLGLSLVPSFSINATCLSFIVALHSASAFIRSGVYRRILIVTAEMPSLSRNFKQPESAALLGDGAAAVLMSATEKEAGLEFFSQQTWPEYADLTQVQGGGLLKHPLMAKTVDEDYWFEMHGESLLRVTLPRLRTFLKSFFQRSELSIEDFDLIVPHQASGAGFKLLQRLGFPENRTVKILSDYGNCVSASIPMALTIAHQQGRVKAGDRILLIGTAAGLSIGAAALRW